MARAMWHKTFMEIGVEKQYESSSIREAVSNFNDSCSRCRYENCDQCAIRQAFLNNADYVFESEWIDNVEIREYVERERALA